MQISKKKKIHAVLHGYETLQMVQDEDNKQLEGVWKQPAEENIQMQAKRVRKGKKLNTAAKFKPSKFILCQILPR
jgi:hypothetical protein